MKHSTTKPYESKRNERTWMRADKIARDNEHIGLYKPGDSMTTHTNKNTTAKTEDLT